MKVQLLDIDPQRYQPHLLHAEGNDWAETNCATDMWIEVLHSLRLDPVPGLAFSVATRFGGDQWTMFTYPAEDLQYLYGVQVNELNVWRKLDDHIEEQLTLGNLVSFDVDAFFLPDTSGLTYGVAHQKTTVCAQMIDREERRLGYFHNAGYAELDGEDFDGVFHLGAQDDPLAHAMPPYADQIRLDDLSETGPDAEAVVGRLRIHLSRRSAANPVAELTKRLLADVDWLTNRDMDEFHRYAFGTARHLGANAQLAAAFVGWLIERDSADLDEARSRFEKVSKGAKRLEFVLARLAAGRGVDIPAVMGPLEEDWAKATEDLVACYG